MPCVLFLVPQFGDTASLSFTAFQGIVIDHNGQWSTIIWIKYSIRYLGSWDEWKMSQQSADPGHLLVVQPPGHQQPSDANDWHQKAVKARHTVFPKYPDITHFHFSQTRNAWLVKGQLTAIFATTFFENLVLYVCNSFLLLFLVIFWCLSACSFNLLRSHSDQFTYIILGQRYVLGTMIFYLYHKC